MVLTDEMKQLYDDTGYVLIKYWYKNGCLFPDMLSVFIPIDPCPKENGCLQVIEGSHKCGRIDHVLTGGQQSCDMERLQHVKDRLAHKYVEMDPGYIKNDGGDNQVSASLKFNPTAMRLQGLQCLVFHGSCPSCRLTVASADLLCAKVPNSAIRECGNYTDLTGKDFMDPARDKTTDITANKEHSAC